MDNPDIEQPILKSSETVDDGAEPAAEPAVPQPESRSELNSRLVIFWLLAAFGLGFGGGYLLWGLPPITPTDSPREARAAGVTAQPTIEPASPISQVSLPEEYTLPVSFGNVGPQLLEAGVIDYDLFTQVYEQAGQPLTDAQLAILTEGSDAPIVFNRENAYFLLNFFWALGLVNQNSLLTEGPMQQYSKGDITRFASTGGWTIGAKPVAELYASAPIIPLTPEQQARLEEVANAVYRPCCNNPTAFPDCNHGMAMLGVLELMASQDATEEEMFTAAKYINAFWFPQQTLEIALVFRRAKGQEFIQADAREFVGANFSSATGFQTVHQWLSDKGLLEQIPNSGNSCGI